MLSYIRRFLYDETFFERAIRSAVMLLSVAVHEGALEKYVSTGEAGWWVSMVTMALSVYMPAGQKNTMPPKE